MTSEEQQAAYRHSCAYARKAGTIYYANDGKLGEVYKTFTRRARHQGKTIDVPAINEAKRWVRDTAPFSTFVAD